ncbi:MAG: [protein-PII] uridylyltransferase [Nitrospiraceae bacterium]|nr:MAG: [protein-PII] uridylyltransferase [Nitrospiraceae bacterium]
MTVDTVIKNDVINEMGILLEQGYGGIFLVERYAKKIDAFIQRMASSFEEDLPFVIIATGGYGRAELAPFSDIDIMLLAEDRAHSEAAEQLLYKLWDTGLTISHSFRTPEECIEEAFLDIKTRTSLLESRYIAGDKRLYRSFRNNVYPEIAYKRRKGYVREKLREMQGRHRDSGDSVFLLEPNIKEGEGSLRDIHTAYWLSKIALKIEDVRGLSQLINTYDFRRLMSAYDFLLRARCSLHLISKRKNDLLSFEYQRNVATMLDFKDSKKFTATERFMRYYYLKSKVIHDVTRSIMTACSRPYISPWKDMKIRKISSDFSVSGGRLIANQENLFAKHPTKIIESFYMYSKTGKRFSEKTKDIIKANLLRISRTTRSDSVATDHFLRIMKGNRVYETLKEMHDAGILGRFIPEFGALRMLVVHEPYHRYTVDEHTLQAIRNLEALKMTPLKSLEYLKTIARGLKHFDVLLLALLFHDIGKAVGRHHEEEGYKRLKNIMDRFNLEKRKRTRVEFLVKNHILMSKIAMKREASDPNVIAHFAGIVTDMENLQALYLITHADMSAVNETFLNSWKKNLLKDLYERTAKYLLGITEDREQYIRNLHDSLPSTDALSISDFIRDMPERYFVSATKEQVLKDYQLTEKMKETGFMMRIDSVNEGLTDITVSTRDLPGLFSMIVGYLSSKGLHIVTGRVFTGKSGAIIDRISVSNWNDVWWAGQEKEIEEGLRRIIFEQHPVTVVRRAAAPESIFDIFIELDNEASEEYSIIEIFSTDRLGLLYDISTVISKSGVNIISAIINTESNYAQDVFYVQTGAGEKVGTVIAQTLLAELWNVLKD